MLKQNGKRYDQGLQTLSATGNYLAFFERDEREKEYVSLLISMNKERGYYGNIKTESSISF